MSQHAKLIWKNKMSKLWGSNHVVFNPHCCELCGIVKTSSLTGLSYLKRNQGAGILLSQLLYLGSYTSYQPFKEADQYLIDQCGTNLSSYKRDKKRLIELGFVTYSRQRQSDSGIWTLNEDKILEAISNHDTNINTPTSN